MFLSQIKHSFSIAILVLFCFAGFSLQCAAADPSTTQDAAKIKIVLVGDSTVNDEGGWGPGFKSRLKPEIVCANWAKNGRSSKSFIHEGWWTMALAEHPTFVLIQFGHNDMPGKGAERETDPQTTYPQFMGQYVDESRAAGATPILVTSMTRRKFESDGKVKADLAAYVDAVKKLAAEKNVPLVDLNASSMALVNETGPQAAMVLDPEPKKRSAESTTTQPAASDKTHLSRKGADVMGELVVSGIKKALPESASWFK